MVFEVPAEHSKNSLREAEVHHPSTDYFELHFLTSLREVYHPSDCSSVRLFQVVTIFAMSRGASQAIFLLFRYSPDSSSSIFATLGHAAILTIGSEWSIMQVVSRW